MMEEGIDTQIQYLIPTSRINRRFWAPGAELNTGEYAPYDVTIRNARLAEQPFTLAEHGFELGRFPTDVTDWEANYGPDSAYAAQVGEIAKAMTGCSLVLPLGGMVRTSGQTSATIQPPAGEAHVDFTDRSAKRIAEMVYRGRCPDGPGYSRAICFSLWRCLSAAPQDWPLALCEGPSVREEEGTHNTKVDVDELPVGDAMFADIPGEEDMAAATIFYHSRNHKWWYFPDMTPDEVIFIKFNDSDRSGAWRAPHTAFRDTSRPNANIRTSMEFRSIAYWEL